MALGGEEDEEDKKKAEDEDQERFETQILREGEWRGRSRGVEVRLFVGVRSGVGRLEFGGWRAMVRLQVDAGDVEMPGWKCGFNGLGLVASAFVYTVTAGGDPCWRAAAAS